VLPPAAFENVRNSVNDGTTDILESWFIFAVIRANSKRLQTEVATCLGGDESALREFLSPFASIGVHRMAVSHLQENSQSFAIGLNSRGGAWQQSRN
jgi:hypothetical protein